jgi:hypothetical protein
VHEDFPKYTIIVKITYKTKYYNNNTHQTQHTSTSLGGRGITTELAGLGIIAISGRTATSGATSTPVPPGS